MLCQFIRKNKLNIRLILPSCILFEEYTETYESDIDINSVPAVTYIYFLHLFIKILEFDWNDYIVNLFQSLKVLSDEEKIPYLQNSFLYDLKANKSELATNYFFLLRVRLEIIKIFLLLIKPFLNKKTLEKYALIMFCEHSDYFKTQNRQRFAKNKDGYIISFQDESFLLFSLLFTRTRFNILNEDLSVIKKIYNYEPSQLYSDLFKLYDFYEIKLNEQFKQEEFACFWVIYEPKQGI